MKKTYIVERMPMIGDDGLVKYTVLESGTWDSHNSRHTMASGKHLFDIKSRNFKHMAECPEKYTPLSDYRYKMVTAYFKGLEVLATKIIRKAYPETIDQEINSLWQHSTDPTYKIIKICT